jgi:hypothetical protein
MAETVKIMVSLKHKTIYIHIPKCAGQSVEETFLKDISEDLEFEKHRHQIGCFQKPPSWDANFPERIAHLTAQQYTALSFVSNSQWNSFFKFTIVRDPVERSVSMWRYLDGYNKQFSDFIYLDLPPLVAQNHFWFQSQSHYILDPTTKSSLVDFILPFSKLNDRWAEIKERSGLERNLIHRNESRGKEKPRLNADLISKIKKIYADDYRYLQNHF